MCDLWLRQKKTLWIEPSFPWEKRSFFPLHPYPRTKRARKHTMPRRGPIPNREPHHETPFFFGSIDPRRGEGVVRCPPSVSIISSFGLESPRTSDHAMQVREAMIGCVFPGLWAWVRVDKIGSWPGTRYVVSYPATIITGATNDSGLSKTLLLPWCHGANCRKERCGVWCSAQLCSIFGG